MSDKNSSIDLKDERKFDKIPFYCALRCFDLFDHDTKSLYIQNLQKILMNSSQELFDFLFSVAPINKASQMYSFIKEKIIGPRQIQKLIASSNCYPDKALLISNAVSLY